MLSCNPEVFKKGFSPSKYSESSGERTICSYIWPMTICCSHLTEIPFTFVRKWQIESQTNRIALPSHASHSLEVDMFRRQSFKDEIKDECNTVCTTSYPAAGSSFGPNVNDKIKEVQESMRVARKTRRFQPYPTRRFPFLDQRQPWNSRGGGKSQSYPQRAPWQQQRSHSYPQ